MNDPSPLSNAAAAALAAGLAGAALVLYAAAWWLVSRGRGLAGRLGARLRTSDTVSHGRPVHDWLGRRFPRAYPLIAARFDPRQFRGLPLTLIAVAAVYLAVLFVGLVESVMDSEEIDTFDDTVEAFVAALRNPALVRLFSAVTRFGDTTTLAAVAGVATGFLWARGPAWGIAPVWIVIAGAQATTWMGKVLIDRPRPEFIFDVTAFSPSFPSGHATGAMAVYGVVAYVIARELPSPRRRFDVIYWTGVLIAAIAFSRIYLSVHHPSDVAAGLLVGGFWLLAGIAVAELLRRAHDTAGSPD